MAPFGQVGSYELLRGVDLFALLTPDQLKRVARLTKPFYLQPGEHLFEEGNEAQGVYLVERGEVEVRIRAEGDRQTTLAHLGNGSVVGEMALIAGGSRSASVVATSPTQGYGFTRLDFELLRDDHPRTASKIVLQLARTLDLRRRLLEDRFHQLREDPEVRIRLKEKATKELIARVRKG